MKSKIKLYLVVLLIALLIPSAFALITNDVSISSITDKSAIVTVEADEPATILINFWPEDGSAREARSSTSSQNAQINLRGLAANTKYYFNVTLLKENDVFYDNNANQQFTFTTSATDEFAPFIDTNIPDIHDRKQLSIVGRTEINSRVVLNVNNNEFGRMDTENGEFYFHHILLNENARNLIDLIIEDSRGNKEVLQKTVLVDTIAPTLNIAITPDGDLINTSQILIKGNVSEDSNIVVTVNDEVKLNTSSSDSLMITASLKDGENTILVTAEDEAGWKSTFSKTITADFNSPEISSLSPKLDGMFIYEGSGYRSLSGKTEPNSKVYIYVDPILSPKPTDGDITGLYSYETTSDGNGNFVFDLIDFQHGKDISRRFTIAESSTQSQSSQTDFSNNRKADVYVTIVDKVGNKQSKKYTITIGNCNEGSFVFSIDNLVEFQAPKYFSLERMKQGTEIFSFVLDLGYSGQAKYNKRKPSTTEIKDDYYEILSVSLEPACTDGAYGDSKSYEWACEVLPSQPKVAMPLNVEKTKWYFSYDLSKLSYEGFDKVSLFDIDENGTVALNEEAVERGEKFGDSALSAFQKETNGELKFPFKVKISYREKVFGQDLATGSQTSCREVANYLDIVRTEDIPTLIPDNIIDAASGAINSTIENIEQVQVDYLAPAIEYVNYACIGSTVSLWAFKIYREFKQLGAIASCIAGSAADKPCPLGNNPITAKTKLDKCYYSGTTDPIANEKKAKEYVLNTCIDETNIDGKRKKISSLIITNPEFAIVENAWNYEETLWKVMRWSCDRTLCRVTPARWTQDRTIEDIRSIKSNEQKCSLDLGNVRSLRKVTECGKNYEKVLVKGSKSIETCYKLDNCLYTLGKNDKLNLVSDVKRDKNNQSDCEEGLSYKKIGSSVYTSLQEKCSQVCERVENWEGECVDKNVTEKGTKTDKTYYSGGLTSDCAKQNKICACYRNDTKAVSKEIKDVESKGAAYAGIDKNSYSSNGSDSSLGTGWKFNYRENTLYAEQGGKAGIYYPSDRYYNGRDVMGGFGLSHLYDLFREEKKITELNPYVDYISPFFPQVCLTGMNARINLLKNHLKMFEKCMQQAKTTGDANSATCKKIFSQGLCNIISNLFLSQSTGCFGQPLSASSGGQNKTPSSLTLLRTAISTATKGMENSLKNDYGEELGLVSYLEGGSVNIAKNICLFALGVDINLDIEAMATVSMAKIPSRSTVLVLTKSGPVGERQMLSFNPANGNALYAYDAAWTISSGCDLDYNIYLSAVTEKEVRNNNLDCSKINAAVDGSNGCDNYNGNSEITSIYYSKSGLTNGEFVDESKTVNLDTTRRYDHMKFVFTPKQGVEIDKCFPKEYIKGNQAVVYFPIKEQFSLADQYGCSVQSNGEFKCTAFGITGQKQAWIQDVKCFNPSTYEYGECGSSNFFVNDTVKLAVEVYTNGDKYCLVGQLPGEEEKILPIVGAGRSETFNVKLTLKDKLILQDFMSNVKSGVWVSSKSNISKISLEFIAAPSPSSGEVVINFTKGSDNKFLFTATPKDKINSRLIGPKIAEINITNTDIEFNGYRFRIKEFITDKTRGSFVIKSVSTSISDSLTRTASLSIYYPSDTYCTKGKMLSVILPEGTAYPTQKNVLLKFNRADTKTSTTKKYYDEGKKLFKQWTDNYASVGYAENAISNFKKAASNSPRGFYDFNSQFSIMSIYLLLSEKISDKTKKEEYKKLACDLHFSVKQKIDAGYYTEYPKVSSIEYVADYYRLKKYNEKIGEQCK